MHFPADRILQRAVTGSITIHVVAFFLLVFGLHRHLAKPDQEPETFEEDIVLNLTSLPEFTIEPEPESEPEPEPEPEPEIPSPPEAVDPRREFLLADHVPDAGQTPEDARFESDRDTVASSRLGPDANAAADTPSLEGDSPRDSLSTVNTDFQDGEPATPAPMVPRAEPVVVAEPPVAEPIEAVDPQPEAVAAPSAPLVAAVDVSDLLSDPLAENPLLVSETPTEAESDSPPTETEDPLPEEQEETPVPDELPPPPDPSERPAELVEAPNPLQTPIMLEQFELPATRAIEQRTQQQLGGAELGDIDSFLAMRTAEGEYKRQLYTVIERRWRRLTDANLAMKTYSQVKVAVVIERDGSIASSRIIESAASPAMREAALRAVQDASLPPVPEAISAPYYYAMEFLVY